MLTEVISRPYMFAPKIQTQKDSNKMERYGVCFSTLLAGLPGSMEVNHLFLASETTEGKNST